MEVASLILGIIASLFSIVAAIVSIYNARAIQSVKHDLSVRQRAQGEMASNINDCNNQVSQNG